MDYSIETPPIEKLQSDCIVVGIYQNEHLSPSATDVNNSTQGLISKILARGDISGKNGETLLINVVPDSPFERLLLVGLGENKPLSGKNYRKALFAAANSLKKPQIKTIVCSLAESDVE